MSRNTEAGQISEDWHQIADFYVVLCFMLGYSVEFHYMFVLCEEEKGWPASKNSRNEKEYCI